MEEEYYTIPTLGLLTFILSIIIGVKYGWVINDYSPSLGLFGLLASVVFYDTLAIKIRKKRK